MLFLRPSHTELLALAAEVIGNWNPCNNSDTQRDDVMLAGKAAAIAIREICEGREVEQATARDISQFYGDVENSTQIECELDINALWVQLAQDIRSGHFDDETASSSVHELLTMIALRCLQVTNPTYFKASGE